MRYDYYKKIENISDPTVQGITIYDVQSVDWSKFEFKSGYQVHTLSTYEVDKPYMVSYTNYGSIDYEDVLLLINNIQDPFELKAGMKLKIPRISDLDDFLRKQTIQL